MAGWIKLWDEVIYHHVWRDDPTAWKVFEYLLISAYNGKPQGTTVKTTQQISDVCFGASGKNGTIYKAIKRLERHQMVKTESTNKRTHFKIVNWWKYQGKDSNGKNEVQTEYEHGKTLSKNKIKNKELSTNVLTSFATTNRKQLLRNLISKLGFSESVRLTDQRLRKLAVRLKTFKEDELLEVAESIGADAFMQGDNDAGKKYGDVDYLLRSDEVVDKWLQRATKEVVFQADW